MNTRIKKKQLKAKLELQNQLLDQELAALKISIKRKEAKLRQEKAKIRALESLKLPEASHIRLKSRSASSYRGTHSEAEGSDNFDLSGAIIKKYHDYVSRGIIKEQSALNKYEAEDWFKENIMTEDMMKEAVDQADKWLEKRQETYNKRMSDLKAGKLYNFGF